MGRKLEKSIGILLCFCLLFTMLPSMLAKAAEVSFVDDGNGGKVFTAENGEHYETVALTQENNNMDAVDAEITIANFSMATDTCLHTQGSTIHLVSATFEENAAIEFMESPSHIFIGDGEAEEELKFYDDAFNEVNLADIGSWTRFVWYPEEEKFAFPQGGLDFSYIIDGNIDVKLTLKYSVDGGSNWVTVDPSKPAESEAGYEGETDNEDSWVNEEFSDEIFFNIERAVRAFEETGTLEDPVVYDGSLKVEVTVETIKESVSHKVIRLATLGYDEWEINIIDADNPMGSLSDEEKTLNFEIPNIDEVPHDLHFSLVWLNEGEDISEKIESNLYAYSDLNGDGNLNQEDMKLGLAAELCGNYFWDQGGILNGSFEITEPIELMSRMTMTENGSITAKDKAGNDVNLKKFDYVIALGVTDNGDEVKVMGSVYGLTDANQILVWTGSQFYIRNLETDAISFDSIDESNQAVCVTADFDLSKLKINGNGCGSDESLNPEGNDVYTVFLARWKMVEVFNEYIAGKGSYTSVAEIAELNNVCNKIRVMKPTETYVVVSTKGESKKVAGINQNQIDSVCQTGEEKYTEVFVGAEELHISPLSSETGITTREVAGVTLKDEAMSDGVKISKKSAEDYQVDFLSNFYDSVTLVVTYSDGTTKDITIKRVGLRIIYQFLEDPAVADPSKEKADAEFLFFHGDECMDGSNGTAKIAATYNYYSGQQIIIYATYYHSSKDDSAASKDLSLFVTDAKGQVRVINKYKYTEATADDVATTDFIIAYVPAKTWDAEGKVWTETLREQDYGAINALVVNSGFDSKTSFGGTQLGNGAGVHWNGKIAW